MSTYNPLTYNPLRFHDCVPAFHQGSDTPRAYLERCLEIVQTREPVLQAFAARNDQDARAAADASTAPFQLNASWMPMKSRSEPK